MKTLHLHIGQPKTATTAIQRFCHANDDRLAQLGLRYVRVGRDVSPYNHNHLYQSFLAAAGGRPQGTASPLSLAVALKELQAEIVESDEPNFLISFEGFSALSYRPDTGQQPLIEMREALKDSCHFNIIYYVRDPVSLVKSNYNQRCKAMKGFVRPFLDFMMDMPDAILDQSVCIDDYSAVFGTESVTTKLFGMLSGQDFLRDFLQEVGVDWPNPDLPAETNVSIEWSELERRRREANAALPIKQAKKNELNDGRDAPSDYEWHEFVRRIESANRNNKKLFRSLGGDCSDISIPDLIWFERMVNRTLAVS